MTIVFSSSSPVASAALFDEDGALLAHGDQAAGHRASGTLLFLLDACLKEAGKPLRDARLFVADVGPGSFTGVKVGVTMAKTMAFAQSVLVGGVSAFDLIDPARTVEIPSRKGEHFLRIPGEEPTITLSVPDDAVQDVCPLARNAGPLLSTVEHIRPELLVPTYVAEPNISKPRDPKILGGPRAR